MKERPILFSAPMVRAILEGRKTQTRRVVNGGWVYGLQNLGKRRVFVLDKDAERVNELLVSPKAHPDEQPQCPYGRPGDRLWVKETFRLERKWDDYSPGTVLADIPPAVWYEADARTTPIESSPWGRARASIHMPQKISRILLEVVSVRVERLQDITLADINAEGINTTGTQFIDYTNARGHWADLWNSINGPDSFASNPWVWAVEFKRIGGGA